MAKLKKLIILAAGMGSRLAPLTDDRPKCLVPLYGKPLLEWQLEAAAALGFEEIVVIGGYQIDRLRGYDVILLKNPDYERTNMVRTLMVARELFESGFVMAYGDIVYAPSVLEMVASADVPIGVVVDLDWRAYWEQRFEDALCDAETLRKDDQGRILEIGQRPSRIEDIQGQYIGLVRFDAEGVRRLEYALDVALKADMAGLSPFDCGRSLDRMYMTDLLQGLVALDLHPEVVPIHGRWVEVDSASDLALAEKLVSADRLG